MNINCVICSDLFNSSDSIFTTPCGHIFHHACLIQWMERKKDCPQCRQKCSERNIFRIYANSITNLDSSLANSVCLFEKVDSMSLQLREYEIKLKNIEEQKQKLEENLQNKEKKIKKLDLNVLQSNQVISTMKHEIDVLASQRANYKVIEAENECLKSKLNLLQTIESLLTASQKEIDEVLKQNLSSRDLSVMVGTLKRELNNAEGRKSELRRQLQNTRNDLRAEQEEKKKLEDELSKLESENNCMINKFKRIKTDDNAFTFNTPEAAKKPRSALLKVDNQLNTPSPLNPDEFNRRIQNIQDSQSPYFKVKKSSIAIACLLKNPKLSSQKGSSTNGDLSKLSIFKKPRIASEAFTKPNNQVYNGLGGTSKILQSDLKSSGAEK